MTILNTIRTELADLGYHEDALIDDYSFSDVLSSKGEEKIVSLAAFTQLPESYRSAAFGVVEGSVEDGSLIADKRALGAPVLFSIDGNSVSVWQVNAEGAPLLLETVSYENLHPLFERNAERWRPQAVHRAKALGSSQPSYQLDFVDLGLLPAIELEVEIKLDRLLRSVIAQLIDKGDGSSEESGFRTTFRLLAAKILMDRKHPDASSWNTNTVTDVLSGIEKYYRLGDIASFPSRHVAEERVDAAWQLLKDGISFRNISSDSLAFVYENTLVTADTRKRFGTHSTPRQVADYVVSQLDFSQFEIENLTVFEPFAGAGIFLVSALRHLRDLLPADFTREERHRFLVERIRGSEIDAFACEVATLSLILADYPNANGWSITTQDLFEKDVLKEMTSGATIVLCNPPWEDFSTVEREQYPETAAISISKPISALINILHSRPQAIGFVLPHGFLQQKQYSTLRQLITETYGCVKLTSLPDRIFQRAGLEAAVIVASELRNENSVGTTKITSASVKDEERIPFLKAGLVGSTRSIEKIVEKGNLWIGELDQLWAHLASSPKLGDFADVYRGLEWLKNSPNSSSDPLDEFMPGIFGAKKSLKQFSIISKTHLNINPLDARRTGPLSRSWEEPKVLMNAARLSRGRWRIAASIDHSGLLASQQFFGIWTKNDVLPLEVIAAILNSPLANAFVTEFGSSQRFTNEMLKQLPVPKHADLSAITIAVKDYEKAVDHVHNQPLEQSAHQELLNDLLVKIDAAVLKAYDLPPLLEHRLLEFFRGHETERRTAHTFDGWIPEGFTAYIPLHEYLGSFVEKNRGAWALDAFTPAPEEEVEELQRYVH